MRHFAVMTELLLTLIEVKTTATELRLMLIALKIMVTELRYIVSE